jgi:hypothetical protein
LEIDIKRGYRAPLNFVNAQRVFADFERSGLPLMTVGDD